ncbi:MAG: hypothetical protein ACTHK7_09505 [Aureliella sp.]
MTNRRAVMGRRRFLRSASAAGLAAGVSLGSTSKLWAAGSAVKPVAGVVTIYQENSHADVLIGKILEGWKQDGGAGPALKLVSLYVDQFPKSDLSVGLAAKHGFRLCNSIDEALTLGTGGIAVEGVLSVGEHGNYPTNAKGQHLYPRRRFFEEITDSFERNGKVVPVFNDKHPGPQLEDMLWMAARARELKVPWMAGSSLTVGYRDPDVTLPMGAKLEACVGVGYSGLDVYGFHTLDFLQSIVERRPGAEKGVRSVQCLPTSAIARLVEERTIDKELLDAALASSQTDLPAVLDQPPSDGAVFLIEYLDGLRAPVLMLPGRAKTISVAFKTSGGKVAVTRAEEREEPKYPHFAFLLKGIEKMIHTGRPAYPVERTLLSSGSLDRLLRSRSENGRRLETPELHIAYQPVDYPYAPHIDLLEP